GVQNFVGRHTWIGQVDRFNVWRQTSLQHAAQHGFAAADFAGYLDDAFPMGNRVDQCLEDCTAIAAFKKNVCVRRNLERGMAKAKEIKVHQLSSSMPDA